MGLANGHCGDCKKKGLTSLCSRHQLRLSPFNLPLMVNLRQLESHNLVLILSLQIAFYRWTFLVSQSTDTYSTMKRGAMHERPYLDALRILRTRTIRYRKVHGDCGVRMTPCMLPIISKLSQYHCLVPGISYRKVLFPISPTTTPTPHLRCRASRQ